MMRYNNLGAYLRARYGENVGKICLDGGFTCPNRDGTCGVGGCIYCGERGSGDHIFGEKDIRLQVERFFRMRPKGNKFIAYFQNFTNTYAPAEVLRERYDAAIEDSRVVALAIGTRPDCITEETAKLIASYKDRVDVWVELGLQTASDETAKRINRGYRTEEFDRAYTLLSRYGIGVVAHMMVGLPGECFEDVCETLKYLNRFSLFGIKIHSTYVLRGTVLEAMYQNSEYTPLDLDFYVDTVVYLLTHLPPDLLIHRLTGDAPKSLLVAPAWNADKNEVHRRIRKALEEHGLTQGCFYASPSSNP